MIHTIAGALLLLWFVAVATSSTAGGFSDLLPIVVVIMITLNLIGRRRTI